MRNKILRFLLITLISEWSATLYAQNFYDPSIVQDIQIHFPYSDWDYRLDTMKMGDGGYLLADLVTINGVQYDSVGVKYKGNSSYDSTFGKNPVHIELDKFKDHNYLDVKDIKLSNGYGDPSMIREALAYNLLKNYMDCPQSNFVKLTINGNYIGLYSSSEDIGGKFCSDHFYSNQNTFVKCNPTITPGPTTKSNFKYLGTDSTLYDTYYEMKSDAGWSEFLPFCNEVTQGGSSLALTLDVDRAIWMLAFNNVMDNFDSYSGVFAQNHYLYQDNNHRFNPIIWDLNMCFGGFPFAGAGASSMGSQTITQLQQFSLSNHDTDPNWPLIVAIQSDSVFKRQYLAHAKTILTEMISSGVYQTMATAYQNLVDNAVNSDPNKFFTYTQFQNAMTTDYTSGSYTVPGIANLMEARKNYLMATSEFSATEPTIATPVFSSNNPVYNSTVTVSVQVDNALSNSVYLGKRFSINDKFETLALYDDGAHNDGAAGDHVYGGSFTMSGCNMQYYVYAHNATIGKFLPARAEHEFFTLEAQSVAPAIGDVVINELLADNVGGEKDEYNDTEDWLELYNNSTQVIDLSNTYLSHNASNLSKWKFPSGTKIAPNGYLTIWTDDDSMQVILHTNFLLNKDTGFVMLTNGTSILDSISFMNQSANVSYGRYPNGTGSFIAMGTTYGYVNNNWPLHVSNISTNTFGLYPNPTDAKLTIIGLRGSYQVYSMLGNTMYTGVTDGNTIYLDTQRWPEGVYILRNEEQAQRFVIAHGHK